MIIQSQSTSTPHQDISKRAERAHRILDAAAALILRWCYNKTTIDDVARQAGVAKGTIYLHWKTREDLFGALIKRENVVVLEDFSRRLLEDPAGVALRGVLKHSALALMKRPLLKALLLRDMDVIGKLAHSEYGNAAAAEKLTGFKVYLEFLREYGLVRADLSLKQQMYTLSAIFMGFFLVAPLMPDEFTLADEELADLLAETVHCTLESGLAVRSDGLQAASQSFIQYLNRYLAFAREQFERELE